MRNNYFIYFFVLAALNLVSFKGFAQAAQKTINMDFGPGDSYKTTLPGWNNINSPTSPDLVNLVDANDGAVPIKFAITSPFNTDHNTTGLNAENIGIPNSASRDTYFGNAHGTQHKGQTVVSVELTFSNLDLATSYSFTFFASRGAGATDNRQAQYTVSGLNTGVGLLDAAMNADKVATASNIVPKADGTIIITIEEGPDNTNSQGFFYLGALFVNYTPGTITGIAKDIAAGRISVYPNPTTGKVSINTGGEHLIQAVQLMNVAGVKVLEQKSTSGSVESLDVSGLPKGLYYMHLQTNKGSFQSKLVVR